MQPNETPENDEAMPAGYSQEPLDPENAAAWAKFVRTNYMWCVVGILLAPVAFLVRVGRWSMRTIVNHHRGWEFGGF